MIRTADLLWWLARWAVDDSLLALRMLAYTEPTLPELAELAACLDRVDLLVGVHRQRLEGASIQHVDGEYLVLPLAPL